MIGHTLSHYRLLEKIGAGGMGMVYRARDERLDRDVAIKVLPPDALADEHARRGFQKEAKTLSRLNHPHIATVHDFDTHDGRDFLVMEFVAGDSLSDKLKTGPLPEKDITRLGEQMAAALEEAHEHGIIHRDLKPANVRLTPKGQVKILDFGIARLLQPAAVEATTRSFTETQALAGTLPYMSPEQLRGEPVDARSDLYSLGVLLYEMATGQRPFQQRLASTLSDAILHQPPPPPSRLRHNLSTRLEEIIVKCLEKEPENRYQSAKELAVDLRRLGASEAVRVAELRKSVAVLYFENLSRSEEDEYFRDGITEDIIIELSKIRELQVFPRSAALAFRDKPTTAPQVGQQLNASFVLGGSVRRAGNRLRITAQLIETRTGHSVWAERYDREMKDVFEVQDDIARSISQALRITLSPQEEKAIARKPTDNPQAYDYYLRGRQFLYKHSREGQKEARQLFARAIVIDPQYARAYAGVADCCSFLYMYHEATEANLKEAEMASQRAVELDPDSAEAHASRGLALSVNKRYDEAAQEFETAIRLNPNLYEAYYFYARTRFAEGKMEEAAGLYEQAGRVNPEDYQVPALLGQVYRSLGRLVDLRAAQRRVLALVEKHVAAQPSDARALYLGAGAACELGEKTRGLEWARRALEIDPNDTSTLYNVACVYSLEGLVEEGLECLEKAVERGFGHKEWIEHDSDLDALRSDPRFQSLLRRLNFPD